MQLEHLQEVQLAQLVFQQQGHQAQAPAVFGGAFLATAGGVGTAQYVLESLRLAQELEATAEELIVHG